MRRYAVTHHLDEQSRSHTEKTKIGTVKMLDFLMKHVVRPKILHKFHRFQQITNTVHTMTKHYNIIYTVVCLPTDRAERDKQVIQHIENSDEILP